jgi:hypothetical protein
MAKKKGLCVGSVNVLLRWRGQATIGLCNCVSPDRTDEAA